MNAEIVGFEVVIILALVIIGLTVLIRGAANANRMSKHMHDSQKLYNLVMAAEQLYGPGKGEAKRRFVREKAKDCGLSLLGREDVEAAVYRLNAAA